MDTFILIVFFYTQSMTILVPWLGVGPRLIIINLELILHYAWPHHTNFLIFDFLGCILSERTLLNPDQRDFWEKLSGWVAPAEEGGGIDIFSPLAACGRWTLIGTHSSLSLSQ